MPETRAATEADIIQADEERSDQAGWLALYEFKDEYNKVVCFKSFVKWRRAVNKRAREIFERLQ